MISRRIKIVMAGLTLAALSLPTTGWTDTIALPAPQIADVSLRDGGVLVGQLVDGQNAPQSGVRIALQDTQNHEVAAATTDRQGSFAISGVRGGLYQVVTPHGRQIYRVWSPGMAPPSAQQGLLLIAPGQTVRGEFGDGHFWTNPAVIGAGLGAGVATAIAVPVTYGAEKQPSSP